MTENPTARQEQELMEKYRGATFAVAAAFIIGLAYLGYSFYQQQRMNALMAGLRSNSPEAVATARERLLADIGRSLPYLCNDLKYAEESATRLRAGQLLLEIVRKRAAQYGDQNRGEIRPGIDIERVTAALLDEDPSVRQVAWDILALTGVERTHQQQRLDDMATYEALLTELKTSPGEEKLLDIRDQFVAGGADTAPYLAGTLFSPEQAYAERGMGILDAVVTDQLKGASNKRAVLILGRRRTRLLMERLTDSDPELVAEIRVILMMSGNVTPAFFDQIAAYLKTNPSVQVRLEYLRNKVRELEETEKRRTIHRPSGVRE